MIASIYPVIGGAHREVKAETDMDAPGGPFDSPVVITGRLADHAVAADLREMARNEVLYEGEVYKFGYLRADGSFELHKSGETSHFSFMVER